MVLRTAPLSAHHWVGAKKWVVLRMPPCGRWGTVPVPGGAPDTASSWAGTHARRPARLQSGPWMEFLARSSARSSPLRTAVKAGGMARYGVIGVIAIAMVDASVRFWLLREASGLCSRIGFCCETVAAPAVGAAVWVVRAASYRFQLREGRRAGAGRSVGQGQHLQIRYGG